MKLEFVSVEIHPTVVDSIRRHSLEQDAKGSYEAVGLVACRYGEFKGVATMPLHNHAPDLKHGFFVEPWEQYRAERKLEQQGYDILGIYHSHPRSEALPSGSDHALAWHGSYVFIFSVIFDELKAYKKVGDFLEPVELLIEEAQ